jgi:hypothetical protein
MASNGAASRRMSPRSCIVPDTATRPNERSASAHGTLWAWLRDVSAVPAAMGSQGTREHSRPRIALSTRVAHCARTPAHGDLPPGRSMRQAWSLAMIETPSSQTFSRLKVVMPSRSVGHLTNERSASPPSPTTPWSDAQDDPVPGVAAAPGEGAEPGSMPDPRDTTALRQLADLGHSSFRTGTQSRRCLCQCRCAGG